jgi:hypothetical protein
MGDKPIADPYYVDTEVSPSHGVKCLCWIRFFGLWLYRMALRSVTNIVLPFQMPFWIKLPARIQERVCRQCWASMCFCIQIPSRAPVYCTISTTSSVTGHRRLWNEHMCRFVTVTGSHERVTKEGVYFLNRRWRAKYVRQSTSGANAVWHAILAAWGMTTGLRRPQNSHVIPIIYLFWDMNKWWWTQKISVTAHADRWTSELRRLRCHGSHPMN